jgi:hypothetical protein
MDIQANLTCERADGCGSLVFESRGSDRLAILSRGDLDRPPLRKARSWILSLKALVTQTGIAIEFSHDGHPLLSIEPRANADARVRYHPLAIVRLWMNSK